MNDPDIAPTERGETDEPPPLGLVRFRRGVVGETKRTCHLVPLLNGDTMPDFLTALCGARIAPGQAELLAQVEGMPCEICMVRAPLPASEDLEAMSGADRPAIEKSGDSHTSTDGGNPCEQK